MRPLKLFIITKYSEISKSQKIYLLGKCTCLNWINDQTGTVQVRIFNHEGSAEKCFKTCYEGNANAKKIATGMSYSGYSCQCIGDDDGSLVAKVGAKTCFFQSNPNCR